MEQEKSLVEQILELWLELTGADPDSNVMHFQYGQEFCLDASIRELKEALRLDESGLAAIMILRRMVEQYFAQQMFSLATLLEDPKAANRQIEQGTRLRQLLQSPVLLEQEQAFRASMIQALDRLSCGKEPREMLEDGPAMGYIRRDAFRSMETLSCYQFSQGEATSKSLRMSNSIFLFWDIPAVIRLGLSMPDCTFLGVVKDEKAFSSFFVLVSKNGKNLTVYTDCPEWKHPLQKEMVRRPDRELANRIARHHFPYSKLDVAYNYDGGAYIRDNTSQGLAVWQKELVTVGTVSELAPDEILWLIMVLALVDQQLYKQNYHLPELTYCSDILFEESSLKEPIQAMVVAAGKPMLTLEKNTVDTLANDPQWKRTPYKEGESTTFGKVKNRPNQWLEEKYKDQVPDTVLNGILHRPSSSLMLPTGDGQLGELEVIQSDAIEQMGYFEKQEYLKTHAQLQTMQGNEFGSMTQMAENYRFLARYNEAQVIRDLALADFKKHSPEVMDWFRRKVMDNLETLFRDMISELEKPYEKRTHQWRVYEDNGGGSDHSSWFGKTVKFYQGDGWTIKTTRCILTGNPVGYACYLPCENQADLLFITGCEKVEDLNEWLQHWNGTRIYFGNPILERIDPMTWVIEDPWSKIMTFSSRFYISKTALTQLCKKYGVDKKKLQFTQFN